MNADLKDEILSVNAIYGAEVLSSLSRAVVLLNVPGSHVGLRVNIPNDYPQSRPRVEGPEASGADLRKGQASEFADVAQEILHRVFRAGEPCMFDLVEELKEAIPQPRQDEMDRDKPKDGNPTAEDAAIAREAIAPDAATDTPAPDWATSEVVTEKKSVFVARAAIVHDPAAAKLNLQHLLSTDKKAAKATHNMTAWRMKNDATGVVYRDCDDDGETAAGSRLLHLLELMNAWNVMVVVSRWYGGVQVSLRKAGLVVPANRSDVHHAILFACTCPQGRPNVPRNADLGNLARTRSVPHHQYRCPRRYPQDQHRQRINKD